MRILLLLMLFASCTEVHSQMVLSGSVKDDSGQPLPGANVMIAGTYLGTITDSKGQFTLSKVPLGEHVVLASFIGYEKQQQTINVTSNSTIDFVLKHEAILSDEIVVYALRANQKVPVVFTSIGREEIEHRNLGQDIPYLLSLTPSLVTSSDAGTGIGYTALRIRGIDQTRINVTINGIPLNDAESHGVWWVDLPDLASSVEDAQVQRGVGVSTNGTGDFGASLNFLTSSIKSYRPSTTAGFSFGSFNTIKRNILLESGLINGHFSFSSHLSDMRSDGFIDRARSNLGSYFVNASYYSDKTVVRFNVFEGNEKTYQAWDGVPSYILPDNRTYNGVGEYYNIYGVQKFYENENDIYKQTHYQMIFSHEWSEFSNANLAFHYTKGKGYYEQYKDDASFESYGLSPIYLTDTLLTIDTVQLVFPDSVIRSGDLIRRLMMDNDFYGCTFSYNHRHDNFEMSIGAAANTYYGRHFGRIIWSEFSSNASENHEWYRGKGIKSEMSVFTRLNYQLSEKMNLYSNLQYRYIQYDISGTDKYLRKLDQSHFFRFFNPKLGCTYTFNNALNFFFLFGIANREPSRNNYTDADPLQKAPESERMYDYETGIQISSYRASITTNLFYMNYHNQLILNGRINDVGEAVMINVPKSYRAGIEISSAVKLCSSFNWNCNVSLSRNKVENFSEFVDLYDADWNFTGQEVNKLGETNLAFSPSLVAANSLSYSFHGLRASLQSKYVGKQYIDNTSSDERMLDAYLTHDLLFEYSFAVKHLSDIKVSLQVNNLLNTEYESNAWVYRYNLNGEYGVADGYFPQAGTHFLAAVSFRF